MRNRTTLARAIDQLGFPKPIAIGSQRIAWDLDAIQSWLAARPRKTPKYVKPGRKPLYSIIEEEVA